MKPISVSLHERIKTIVNSMGYELAGCQLIQAKGSVLRIYIDHERGITIDNCTAVSRQISALLDVEEPLLARYTLEVSSPGIERPLFEIDHFQKQLGKRIKVRLRIPLENRRQLDGILTRIDHEQLCFLIGTNEIWIPFSNIEKANLVADIR